MSGKLSATKSSQADDSGDVPPLAVYHICRVCLRTRSARYHRDHPIPIDGLPPPPSDICRRCRILPADERITVVDVTEEGRSNNIRIGVASLVPKDDYISNEETQRRRAHRLLSDYDWEELEPSNSAQSTASTARSTAVSYVLPTIRTPEDVIYRHVRRPTSVKPEYSQRSQLWIPPPPHLSSSNAPSSQKLSEPHGTPYKTVVIPPMPPIETKGSPLVSSKPATERTVEIRTLDRERLPPTTLALADPTSCASSPATATEFEIRKLAREEIVRYRRAERRLEAHKDPFAHGNMVEVHRVPADRRIDKGKDVPVDLTWESSKAIKRKDSVLATAVDDEPQGEHVAVGEISSTKATTGTEGRPEINLSTRLGEIQQSYDRKERSDTRSHTSRSTTSDARPRGSAAASDVGKHAKMATDARGGAVTAREVPQDSKIANSRPSPEHEYEYTRRIVMPTDGRIPPSHSDNTHFEKREYLRREVRPQQSKAVQDEAKGRTLDIRRRVSDASSRVHFSKKLDVSPTPPDSEASSSEFRYYATQGYAIDRHIGRGDYRRQRRGHTQSEARAGLPEAQLPEHILSESPSRELQQHSMKARERKGYGPYVMTEKRSTSVDVEDGSTVGSASWSGSGYARREERRGAR